VAANALCRRRRLSRHACVIPGAPGDRAQ
jgi:hypothetical protein